MFAKYINVDGSQESPKPPGDSKINTLPPELMLKIFQALAAASPQADDDVRWDHERVSRDWLVVNAVCRYWRRVACAFPILWRDIDVGSCIQWLQLCLARSGSAPLNIRLYDRKTLLPANVFLLTHVGRIRSLKVTADAAADSLHALGSLFMVGMPALEELYLDADRRGAPFAGKCLHDVFRLDRTSEKMFPSLHTLHLSGLYLPPTPSLLRGLRVLELVESRPGPTVPAPSFEEFLDALEACPTLEHLKLWNSFPFSIDDDCIDPVKADRVVALPSLSSLSLFCASDLGDAASAVESTRCRHFLSHMRLAERTKTTLFVPIRHGERKSFLDHCPNNPAGLPILRTAHRATLKGAWDFYASTFCPCDQCGVVELQLNHSLEGKDGMEEGGIGPACGEDTHQCGNLSMMLVDPPCGCPAIDSGVAEEDNAAREFAELFAAAPLRRLQVFYGASQVGFGHLFSTFRGLAVLTLQCCAQATSDNLRDFVYALAGPFAWVSDGEHPGDVDAPLPQLRFLCLHTAEWYGELAQDLESCLRYREAHGSRKLYELHVELKSAGGPKSRKLNKKRGTKLRALADRLLLVERPVKVEFWDTVRFGGDAAEN